MKKTWFMIRKLAALLLAACAAFSVLSCGNGAGGNGRTSEPAATPTPEPIIDPGTVELSAATPVKDILEGAGTKVNKRYYRKGYVIAVPLGEHYGFWGLAKQELEYESTGAVNVAAGECVYTTVYFIAGTLGMRHTETAEGAELTLDETLTLKYTVGKASVEVNGEEFPCYPPQKSGANIYIDCVSLAKLLEYESHYDREAGLFLMYPSNIGAVPEEQVALYRDRIKLYRDVVFNTDDVPCDDTGAGLYKPVPYEERQVGIAYTTWFRKSWNWSKDRNWDLPMLGGYYSGDEAIIYQHGVWLAEAGIDFVFVDWSNNVAYDPATMRTQREDFRTIEESTELLFKVWATIPHAPKICIFTGPGHVHQQQDTFANGMMQAKNDQIYNTFIANEEYNKMYYYYEGKPLLMCYGATPSFARKPDEFPDDRFTVRWVTGYVGQQSVLFDKKTLVSSFHWSWEERGAQTFTVKDGRPEAMTVVASWRKQSEPGKSGYIAPGLRDNGSTYKMQWARADLIGPKFVLVVSFNEWTLGEQVSMENAKDNEPSATLGSLYLDILREQIKKFKGKL
ncbi:MAG: hypothetical protein J5584_04735 [Clostridia bacterium]|nr:hypothetical protein [Clostridia bacterium]